MQEDLKFKASLGKVSETLAQKQDKNAAQASQMILKTVEA
jgi:hypothetical protein